MKKGVLRWVFVLVGVVLTSEVWGIDDAQDEIDTRQADAPPLAFQQALTTVTVERDAARDDLATVTVEQHHAQQALRALQDALGHGGNQTGALGVALALLQDSVFFNAIATALSVEGQEAVQLVRQLQGFSQQVREDLTTCGIQLNEEDPLNGVRGNQREVALRAVIRSIRRLQQNLV